MDENRELIVKAALTDLLREQDECASISAIDDIVLTYVVSILEDLGQDAASSEAFDVEEFVEMMEAYLPGFAKFDNIRICEWMFELAAKLENKEEMSSGSIRQANIDHSTDLIPPQCADMAPLKKNSDTIASPFSFENLSKSNTKPSCSNHNEVTTSQESPRTGDIDISLQNKPQINGKDVKARTLSDSVSSETARCRRKYQHSSSCPIRPRRTISTSSEKSRTSESSDGGTASLQVGGERDVEVVEDEQVNLLTEMFPSVCHLEAAHCLVLAHGDIDTAVNLVLHRQETGEALKQKQKTKKKSSKSEPNTFLDENKVKSHILERYSYVSLDDDNRHHKPMAPKREPQKLTRYLDSKIVNTKGQRFTEIKKSEDEDMKKTYVNLKPAKQYRFH